jgi:hypothetical protein
MVMDGVKKYQNLFEKLAVCLLMMSVPRSHTQLLSFRISTAVNGSLLCAATHPTFAVSVDQLQGIPAEVPNAIKCAYHCTVYLNNTGCVGFNYWENGLCQLYEKPPSICGFDGKCTYYQVRETYRFNSIYENFTLKKSAFSTGIS